MVLVIIIAGLFFLKGNITGFSIMDVKNIDLNIGMPDIDIKDIGNNIVNKEVQSKVVQENFDTPLIYFCPRFNCSAVMVDLITNAKKSIHCALFDLDLYEIIEALDEKHNTINNNGIGNNEKIDIKIVVDNDNVEEIEKSYGKDLSFDEDGFVKIDNSNQLTHNKFCIVDGKYITTGSFNPTINGNIKNNNNLVVVQSYYLAENYEEEFEELWNGYFGRSNKNKQTKVKYNRIESNKGTNDEIVIENLFCPDDRCEEKVIEILDNVEDNVKFMIFSFTSDPIGDKLIELHNNGIEVEGVVEKKQNTNKYSEYTKLLEAGVNIMYDNNKYNMHHKTFIVDDNIVITGSYNPTASGTEKNDENILIIYSDDVANKYLEEYVLIN